MSTLVVATLKSNSSSPPAFQNTSGTEIGQLCRAWVNFNGTGTVAIRAQFNVSSITDNGTGDYTVNFTNAMTDANYSYAYSHQRSTTSNDLGFTSSYSSTTTSIRLITMGSTGTLVDYQSSSVAIFR